MPGTMPGNESEEQEGDLLVPVGLPPSEVNPPHISMVSQEGDEASQEDNEEEDHTIQVEEPAATSFQRRSAHHVTAESITDDEAPAPWQHIHPLSGM